MIAIVPSKNGVPIRLTDERWTHITEEHSELAGLRLEVLQAIAEPERILEGERDRCWPCENLNQARISLRCTANWSTMGLSSQRF